MSKPDPGIFEIAARAAGVPLAAAWHVGDSLAADVAGAANAHLGAGVWLNRPGAPLADGARPDHEIALAGRAARVARPLLPDLPPADRTVQQLPDQVSVTVVARVLLDHVHVDPAQPEVSPRRCPVTLRSWPAALRRLVSHSACHDRQVRRPVSVVKRDQFAVLHGQVGQEVRGLAAPTAAPG